MTDNSRRQRAGTTVDELYLVLRERIVDGTYQPNTRMSQDELAGELSVSRTPVREALRRLQADGFLLSSANRGMQVAPVANGDTEQHYAVRLLVEPPTLSALLNQITDRDRAEMGQALDVMSRSSNRLREFQEAHRRFHDVALDRYPPYLANLTRSLHTMIYRHQRLYFSRPSTPEDFVSVDRLMLAAIRDLDTHGVRQLLEFHLLDAAIGLVLDDDPDHEFSALILALDGLGIQLDHDHGRVRRPAVVRWAGRPATWPKPLETSNLIFTPVSRGARAPERPATV